jgi:hypothetical protein
MLQNESSPGDPEVAAEKAGVRRIPLPPDVVRVETGAVQFGDDWPGLFVRGDNAMGLLLSIRTLRETATRNGGERAPPIDWALHELDWLADLIERDVIVRPAEAVTTKRQGSASSRPNRRHRTRPGWAGWKPALR